MMHGQKNIKSRFLGPEIWQHNLGSKKSAHYTSRVQNAGFIHMSAKTPESLNSPSRPWGNNSETDSTEKTLNSTRT